MAIEEIQIPKLFFPIEWKILMNSAEARKADGRTIWYCNKCYSFIEVPQFMRGSYDIVNIVDDDRKICETRGKLNICPCCYRVIHATGVGKTVRVNTQYKLDLLKKSPDFNYGVSSL